MIVLRTLIAIVVGGAVGLGVTLVSVLIGAALESTLHTTVYAWEFAPLIVGAVSIAGGAVVAPLATLSGTWLRGLVIGAVAHALLFGWLLHSADPTTGPAAVILWSFATGVAAGSLAGALGGLIGQMLDTNRHVAKGDAGVTIE